MIIIRRRISYRQHGIMAIACHNDINIAVTRGADVILTTLANLRRRGGIMPSRRGAAIQHHLNAHHQQC